MTRVERTHDKQIYLAEEHDERPKETVKMILRRVADHGGIPSGATVCDFGCAGGELLAHLHREAPGASYIGYDIVPELLEKARRRVSGASFVQGSVLDRGLRPGASLDIAIMVGVHTIFDAVEPLLANLLRWTRPGGRVYVLGPFNPFPVDVWVTYRLCDDPDPDHREPEWNLFSTTSVSRYLDQRLGPGRHTYTPFELPFDVLPRPDDPARTWTMRDPQGRRILTNGLSLLLRPALLDIAR